MKQISLLLLSVLVSTSTFGAPKDCGELRREIEQEIRHNGLPDGFLLEILPRDQLAHAQLRHEWLVVGWCENGTKFIVYRKMK